MRDVKVAITGASGLIGFGLTALLRADEHQVVALVRRAARSRDEISWDPARRRLDPAALADVDAVVHLAGVGIGDRRWTQDYKQKVLSSRVDGTETISEALAAAGGGRRVLLSASAVGYYGDTGVRSVDEHGAAGEGFLAEVCRRWEAATAPAETAGVRVLHLRTGLVCAPRGGLLSRIVPLFKVGLGSRLGSGRQYWPWISLADELGAIRFLLGTDLAGPVNLTGPAPVTNAEFTKTLARVLRRPALAPPVPAFALRAALGEFADEGVLVGQRALPVALGRAGYRFRHETVQEALSWATHQAHPI